VSRDNPLIVNIKGDTTIKANFEIIQYTLKVENNGNGVTNPTGEHLYECGEEILIYAAPVECYTFMN